MSIQSVSGNGSLWQTVRNDLWTISQDLTALQAGQNSGNQDQIQISQEALQTAMTSFQNDISTFQNSANGNSSTGATSSDSSNQTANPLQTLSQDVTALQNALTQGNQDQIQSAENTLQNDILALQSHYHNHHHHHHGSINGNSTDQPLTHLQSIIQDVTALQNALTQGNQDQIQSAENTLQNDLLALQSAHQQQYGQSVNLQV